MAPGAHHGGAQGQAAELRFIAELTSASESDCKAVLESCKGDVDLAIQSLLNSECQ